MIKEIWNKFISWRYRKLISGTKHEIQYNSIGEAIYALEDFKQIVHEKTDAAKELSKILNKRINSEILN